MSLYPLNEGNKTLWVAALIVGYSTCSSMLLILNKVAVTYVPAPFFILLCQVLSASGVIYVARLCGSINCEGITLSKAKQFTTVVIGFVGALACNMAALQYVPVDTIICLRASSPLMVALLEYVFLGREMPSLQSWMALGGVFVGVAAYTSVDMHFLAIGYFWLALWYFFAVAEMIWTKKIVDNIDMTSWSCSLYNNLLSAPLIAAMSLATSEIKVDLLNNVTVTAGVIVLTSCVAGIGMSYFSFALRAEISATSFSVIGNVCKVLTIAVNICIWDKHASIAGTAAILFALAMGALYKQSPLRGLEKAETA